MLLLVIGLSQVSVALKQWNISHSYSLEFTQVTHMFLQYLKNVKPMRDFPIFERFPVLICVSIIWIYSIILTASGAYHGKHALTQHNCRTDRANLISTAPWCV